MKFKIKEARLRAGLSQGELASKIGVAQSTFNGYENGNHDPKSKLLVLIAQACDTSVDYLLGITDEPSTHTYDQTKKSPAPEGTEDEEEKVQMVVQGLTRLLVEAGWIAPGADLTDAQFRTLVSYVVGLSAYFNGEFQS